MELPPHGIFQKEAWRLKGPHGVTPPPATCYSVNLDGAQVPSRAPFPQRAGDPSLQAPKTPCIPCSLSLDLRDSSDQVLLPLASALSCQVSLRRRYCPGRQPQAELPGSFLLMPCRPGLLSAADTCLPPFSKVQQVALAQDGALLIQCTPSVWSAHYNVALLSG